jgi:hypothetical protein
VNGIVELEYPLSRMNEILGLEYASLWPGPRLTTGWTIGVRSPAGAKDFSSSTCVQTGSGAYPATYPVGTERGKARPRRDADYSPPSSAEVKYE